MTKSDDDASVDDNDVCFVAQEKCEENVNKRLLLMLFLEFQEEIKCSRQATNILTIALHSSPST
jgi:invasion protein IalB